jgi:membrane protease YdiL (CAAX protease family)
MKKNTPLFYIGFALGITWLLWIPALVLVSQKGYPLPTIDYLLQQRSFQFVNAAHIWAVTSFSLAVYGPVIAALLAAWVEGGRQGVRDWFAPVLRWRVAPRWYAIVLAVALFLVALPVLVGWLPGLVTPRSAYTFPSIAFIGFLFLYQFLTSGLGEEPGWRGYLLPRWQAQFGADKAIWYTGLIWALWHFPFTIFFLLRNAPDLPLAAQLSMLLPSLAGQTMSLIGMTYIYAWLLRQTESVFIAMLFHALGNTLNALAAATLVTNPVVSLAIAAMPWLVVWIIEKTSRPAVMKDKAASAQG